MFKVIPFLFVACVAMLPAGAFADENDARWGGKELREATAAAFTHFTNQKGEAAFATISAIAVEINSQGIAATAKVTYVNATGVKKVASYFCHTHDTEIDCH